MKMGRTYHKALPYHIRWAQAREAEADQVPDYFNKLVGPHWSKVARDRNEWKVFGNQLNAVNHSRGLAQRMSL